MPTPGNPLFSILTCAFDTPPEILRETAQSVFAQTCQDFEWVLLDNGSARSHTRAVLAELAGDPRVVHRRLDQGLGILAGLRHCLEHAKGTFVLVLDHDDLLTPDALELTAKAFAHAPYPTVVYSDETIVEGKRTIAEYRRPDWDPILNLGSSYVFHLLAFRRDVGLREAVYSDRSTEYCQDWDTVCRLSNEAIAHVPRVLYHWRRHKSSATNQSTPDSGSLRSQRALLERLIAARPDHEHFAVVPCPIDRGAPELHVARAHTAPAAMDLVFAGEQRADPGRAAELARASGYPFRSVRTLRLAEPWSALEVPEDGYLCFVVAGTWPQGEGWPWEALGLLEWHASVAIVAPRLIDQHGRVLAGPDDLDSAGRIVCRHSGRRAEDSGPWGLATKPQTAGAVHPAFWIARNATVRAALRSQHPGQKLATLGAWVGEATRRSGQRIAFCPYVVARTRRRLAGEKLRL